MSKPTLQFFCFRFNSGDDGGWCSDGSKQLQFFCFRFNTVMLNQKPKPLLKRTSILLF
jgi:hypothetical protein